MAADGGAATELADTGGGRVGMLNNDGTVEAVAVAVVPANPGGKVPGGSSGTACAKVHPAPSPGAGCESPRCLLSRP